MAANCAGLGDSQVEPSCESRLAAASAGARDSLKPAVDCLRRFRKLCSMSQDQPFIRKSSLGVDGAESLGISKAGETVLARLMESQIWHQPAGSMALWAEGSEKGQWTLLTLMPDTSASPSMPLVPFKLPPQLWSSEGVSLSR